MSKRVYVAGPIGTGPKVMRNVLNAIDAGEEIFNAGGCPFIPHVCVQWAQIYPQHHYEDWMKYDAEWLEVCDAVYRMAGISPGADREVEYAQGRGLPVFTDMNELKEWLKS